MGIGPSTLSKLTRNKRIRLEVLEKICMKLDCSIGYIADYVNDYIEWRFYMMDTNFNRLEIMSKKNY